MAAPGSNEQYTVEDGQAFAVTRDGHEHDEPTPLRRRFVARDEFVATSRDAAAPDIDAFRTDQAAAADQEATEPYEQ